jgi:hypothetical protein
MLDAGHYTKYLIVEHCSTVPIGCGPLGWAPSWWLKFPLVAWCATKCQMGGYYPPLGRNVPTAIVYLGPQTIGMAPCNHTRPQLALLDLVAFWGPENLSWKIRGQGGPMQNLAESNNDRPKLHGRSHWSSD